MITNNNALYIPSTRFGLTANDISRWYLNLIYELNLDNRKAIFDIDDVQIIKEHYIQTKFLKRCPDIRAHLAYILRNEADIASSTSEHPAPLLQRRSRAFFYHHYCRSFAIALRHMFRDNAAMRILDLGCGLGTHSLLFSILGASVTSIDIDAKPLEIFKKRITLYESVLKRPLDITILCQNALEVSYERYAPFDGLYSLFAFNMMQPSTELIPKLAAAMKMGGRWAVHDGNSLCWFYRWFRKRNVLSPYELSRELVNCGFEIDEHSGMCSIPPVFWRVLPEVILLPIDSALNKHWFFATSHQILATKI